MELESHDNHFASWGTGHTSRTADTWQTIAVELAETGEHWVVVQVHERAPDRMAWSAPIFVQRHGKP